MALITLNFLTCSGLANTFNSFDYKNIFCVDVLEDSESCSIVVLYDEEGNYIINVIAAVATVFLPEVVGGICKRTIGDPDICNSVYDVTSALVSIKGRRIYKGVTKGLSRSLNWVANKGSYKSKATIETTSYNIASGLKTVFETYRHQCSYGNGIPWESINVNDNSSILGSINNVEVYEEGDTYMNNQKGMKFNFHFDAFNLSGKNLDICIYFSDHYGNDLKDISGNYSTASGNLSECD